MSNDDRREIKAKETQHPSSMIDELTSDGLVRLILHFHLAHIYRMEEWEKQQMMPFPEWDCSMEVLLSAARILQKNESAQKRFETRSKAGIPVPEPQASEEAQRPQKLTELDRQRRREAGEHVKNLIERKIKESQVN